VSGVGPDATTETNPGVGLAYITIHLDYGLKKTSGWDRTGSDNLTATHGTYGDIANEQVYAFAVGSSTDPDFSDEQNPTSINNFKKSVGVAVITLKSESEDPVKNVKAELRDARKALIMSDVTDEDGFCMIDYKHKGKAATYYVNLPAYGISQKITLKANGFEVVDFPIP